ncbi:hypothetical protein [Spongiactinospora sp. TRM90649]|nr:hypothetical protein [Spongiactinospora sp. TRM90649]MDF5758283.1 hypothetical protein [Spongiactinospora sp. TRM90649]
MPSREGMAMPKALGRYGYESFTDELADLPEHANARPREGARAGVVFA